MNKKVMYCTLDTETVGGAVAPTGMYNVGCIIHDKEGRVYATTSMLVMEHFDEIRGDDYAKRNFHIYEEGLQRGIFTCVATEHDAVEVVRNLCHAYGVKYVMAYNSGFDFVKTACRELLDEFEFIDIYLMALQTITHQKGYARFCNENEMYSGSGKTCATSAEAVYAYITKNPDYVEEHTALEDSKIEKDIFVKCASLHQHYDKNLHNWDCKNWDSKCFPARTH